MKRIALAVFWSVFAGGWLLAAPQLRADTFVIQTTPDHSVSISANEVQKTMAAFERKITFTIHGESHTATAVPLLDMLKSAGAQVELKMDPKANPKTKNLPLRQTVIIIGKDGYSAAIALGELLPEIGNREAYLAIDRDGGPLPERAAPIELIVPGDQKPGRWVRAVASIVIESPAAVPSTQP